MRWEIKTTEGLIWRFGWEVINTDDRWHNYRVGFGYTTFYWQARICVWLLTRRELAHRWSLKYSQREEKIIAKSEDHKR